MEIGNRGKRRKRSKNTNYYRGLPLEIVYVILLLIPARFLMKLRLVCKSWMSLISSYEFIRSHTLLSKEEDSHILVRCTAPFFKAQSISLYSLVNNAISNSYDLYFPVRNTHGEGMIVGSCRGLICVSFDDGCVVLWNPCTKESEMLCNSGRQGSGSYGVHGFAFSESTDKFIVVCLSTSFNENFEYVTQTKLCSSKREGWKRILDFPIGSPFFNSGKFVNGSLNWLASRKPVFNLGVLFDSNSPWALVSFNVEKETFIEVVPPKIVGNEYDLTLGVLKQCLSIFCNYETSHADIWLLTSSVWNKLYTISFTNGPPLSPLCMLTNGDILLEFGSQIIVYTPKEDKMKVLQINNFGGCMEAEVYTESLISPKMEHLKVEAKRTMSEEEQQVSKAKKHTDGGKYGGAENGRKRKFSVSVSPLTLSESGSFSSEDDVDWVSHKAFNDLKGKQVEVVRPLPEDATCSSGCHPMCGRGSFQSYSAPGYWYGAAGIGCSGYGSYGCRLLVEAQRTMSKEEQQVSKAKKHTDGGKYGGAENGRKRKFLPLTLSEAGSFSSEDDVDWVSHKAFHDLKGKQVEVVRALPEDATCRSGCHPMCGHGSFQSYSEPGYLYGAAGIGCSGYGSYGGASSGYGGPAVAANAHPTDCDACCGRGPLGFWHSSAGIDFGYGSYGGASSRHGGPAVAPNGNPSVCNDGCGRGPPGGAKYASGYGKNRRGAGCSGHGETLES